MSLDRQLAARSGCHNLAPQKALLSLLTLASWIAPTISQSSVVRRASRGVGIGIGVGVGVGVGVGSARLASARARGGEGMGRGGMGMAWCRRTVPVVRTHGEVEGEKMTARQNSPPQEAPLRPPNEPLLDIGWRLQAPYV